MNSASHSSWSKYQKRQDIHILNRSRLFSIEPIGIGTWYCESLSSYLKRIAQAHQVTVSNLLNKVLLPESNCRIKHIHPLWRSSLHSINGSSDLAEVFVNLLENATSRNLSYLTLLPLDSIIGRTGRGVLSQQLKVCPFCLYEFSKHQIPSILNMVRQTKPLTNTEVKNAKQKEKILKLNDGLGLQLRIKPNGAKTWLFDYYKPHSN